MLQAESRGRSVQSASRESPGTGSCYSLAAFPCPTHTSISLTRNIIEEKVSYRPALLCRCSQSRQDQKQLINIIRPVEEWVVIQHFPKDAAHAPHVDSLVVLSSPVEEFGGSVPAGSDLMRVWAVSRFWGVNPRQAKV